MDFSIRTFGRLLSHGFTGNGTLLSDMQLQRDFYERNTLLVARELIGMRLVRLMDNVRLAGIIVEAEAYRGEEDLGCHAKAGYTSRTSVMYGPAGHAYVYFTYGKHWMLNFVTEQPGFPAAVLIRAIEMEEGREFVARRRNRQPFERWTDGPAKLCQALGIDGNLNGHDLCAQDATIFVESNHGNPIFALSVTTSPRVGLNNVPEPWKSIPWRYLATQKPAVMSK
jgi:DNA-3-methyladenine glycosylase